MLNILHYILSKIKMKLTLKFGKPKRLMAPKTLYCCTGQYYTIISECNAFKVFYLQKSNVLTPTSIISTSFCRQTKSSIHTFFMRFKFFFFLGDWVLASTIRNYCVVVIVEYSKICRATLQQTVSDLVCNITGGTGAMRNKNSGVLGVGTDFFHCVEILSYQHHIHNFLW